ncbi:hypothetical protein J8J40_35055, partial [Mycobacterium tuberculosis]|nr:hypothetical protein [Mycobacterium tuberculosis]
IFDAVISHLVQVRQSGRRVLVVAASEGSLDRLSQVLADHGLGGTKRIATFPELFALKPQEIGLGVLAIETGVETAD